MQSVSRKMRHLFGIFETILAYAPLDEPVILQKPEVNVTSSRYRVQL